MDEAKKAAMAVKSYFEGLKKNLKPDKFHLQAPTPQLLRKAQKAAGDTHPVVPHGSDGKALPYPRCRTKSDIFKKEDYRKVDSHALKAPEHLLTADLSELVDYLVTPFSDDVVAKVRAIFRWIAGQDLQSYHVLPDIPVNSPSRYLNDIKQSKGRYDKLFNDMCKYANIPTVTIHGHSKGVGYNVGDPLTPSTKNMWNAVLLNNAWHLIDVHWASRKVSGVESEEWQLVECQQRNGSDIDDSIVHDVYEFDEFYFLTDPEEFIYSHYPDDEVWQLLARPLTKSEFQKALYLKPHFFKFGLMVKSHSWCTLRAVEGIVNIELGVDRSDLSFSFELYRSSKVASGEGKQKLINYLLLERNPEEKKLCVEIRFPVIGKYKAEIFGQDSRSKLEWLCSYVLYCDNPLPNCLPLPPNPKREWGPGANLSNYGITPVTHSRGKIQVYDGEVEIKFALEKNIYLLHRLISVDDTQLNNCILHETENGIATLNVRLPRKGQYALCIYAKSDPDQTQFSSICNYLLRCDEEFGNLDPYPEVLNGKVGPTETFHSLELSLCGVVPGLQMVSNTGECSFQIKIPTDVEYFAKMQHQSKLGSEDISEYIYWYREEDIVTFNIRCPKTGYYRFDLYAKSAADEGGYPKVFCCVLEASWPMVDCLPFPQKYAAYKDTYRLLSPTRKLLAVGQKIEVAVIVDDAEIVAMLEEPNWVYFKKNEKGIWTGQITPSSDGASISLAAKKFNVECSFEALMSFEVVSANNLRQKFLIQRTSREDADQEYLEQIAHRQSLSNKRKGRAMFDMIQRVALMKQQNLNDESLLIMDQQLADSELESLDQLLSEPRALSLPDVPAMVSRDANDEDASEDLSKGLDNFDEEGRIKFVIRLPDEDFQVDNENRSDDDSGAGQSESDNEEKLVTEEKEEIEIAPKIDVNLNVINKEMEDIDEMGLSITEKGQVKVDSLGLNSIDQELENQLNDELSSDDQEELYSEEITLKPEIEVEEICPERLEPVRAHLPFNRISDVSTEAQETQKKSMQEEDLTEKLLKQVAAMEREVEEDEMALKNFHLPNFTDQADDGSFLRHRQSATTTTATTSLPSENQVTTTSTVSTETQTMKENNEVPLSKFVEYFVYMLAILTILWQLLQFFTWFS